MLAPPAFFQDGKSGLPRHLSWDHAVSDIAPCCLTERNMHAGMARRPCHFYHVRCPAAGLCNDQERGLRYHAPFRGCTYGPGYRRPRLCGPRPTAHDSWTRTRNKTPALHHRWLSFGPSSGAGACLPRERSASRPLPQKQQQLLLLACHEATIAETADSGTGTAQYCQYRLLCSITYCLFGSPKAANEQR